MGDGGEFLEKEIVLLTKSKKLGNYCIAGVDTKTGEWVRIISDDASIQHAIPSEFTRYEDDSVSEVMDIVRIRCKSFSPENHQPENYVMDNKIPWKKKGTVSVRELLKIHDAERRNFLFYNTDKSVESTFINKLENKERYSLILIEPKDICIHVKEWPERKQVTTSFDYAKERYWYIRITDTEFEERFSHHPEGNYGFKTPCLFVISLGDENTDNKHWKLIASVIYI